jgi:hypothetical protein
MSIESVITRFRLVYFSCALKLTFSPLIRARYSQYLFKFGSNYLNVSTLYLQVVTHI